MRSTTQRTALFVVFTLFAVTGCFRLGRSSPPLEQYVLGGSQTAEQAASTPGRAGLLIGIRRLELAPYLAIPSIVVRHGTHRMVISEFHRWGEELGEGINRAVAGYLATEPPIRAVDIAPWPVRARHDYLVQLHVSRFEGVVPEANSLAQGEAHVLASWTIIRPQDGAVLARGSTDYSEGGWRVGDYSGLVVLLDRGLSVLARDLASCLGRLGSAPPLASAAELGPPVACP
jgi:uncharacterized protein